MVVREVQPLEKPSRKELHVTENERNYIYKHATLGRIYNAAHQHLAECKDRCISYPSDSSIRAERDAAGLLFDVCERHLLNCVHADINFKA